MKLKMQQCYFFSDYLREKMNEDANIIYYNGLCPSLFTAGFDSSGERCGTGPTAA